MLTILPEKDQKFVARALADCGTLETPAVLTARGGEKTLGFVALDITAQKLRLLKLELDHAPDFVHLSPMDRPMLDGLLKAAASYALNREIFYLECENKELFPFLLRYGFQETAHKVGGYLSLLLHNC